MGQPAFGEQFRERLNYGKYTRWANNMSEETLYSTLWAIGEWARRTYHAPLDPAVSEEDWWPEFPPVGVRLNPIDGWQKAPPYMRARSMAGLEILYRIYSGQKRTEEGEEFPIDLVRKIINSIE